MTQTQSLNSQQTKEPSTISNNLTFLKTRQVHSSGEVLLVGEDQHRHSLSLGQPVAFFYTCQFLFLPLDQPANPLQLQLGLLQPLLVARVHDEDDRVRGACVRPPEGPRLVLPSDVPDVEDPTQSRLHLRIHGSMEILESLAGGVLLKWKVDGGERERGDGMPMEV